MKALRILLAAAGVGWSGAGVAAEPQAPQARVVRAAEAPVIDGRGADAVWAQAIEVADLIAPDSSRPMQEASAVRLAWDEACLYVFARLEESLLITASQQLHEIHANAKEHDGKVIADDCFILLLRRGEQVYEWNLNTLGTVADARAKTENPWATRDLAWNPEGVRSAVVREEGAWAVEMAIPWKALEAKAPAPGEQWQAVLGRNAVARRESGAWNPSHGGIHSPVVWGELSFGEPVAGVAPQAPVRDLESGANRLRLKVAAAGREVVPLLVSTKLQAPGQRTARTREMLSATAGRGSVVEHAFEVGPVGAGAQFAWAVRDAGTLETLYQSAEVAVEVAISNLELHLSTAGAWRLRVNDAEVASGERAEDEKVRIPLRSGANVIALEAQSGRARLRLASELFGPAPLRWKTRPASPGASRASVDDAAWPTAREEEGGEVVAEGPATFRHTVLLRETRIFPAPKPAFYVAAGGLQPVTFTAFGVEGRVLRGWQMWLELPAPVEAAAATGYYGRSIKGKPQFALHPEGEHRYRIEASEPISARPEGQPPVLAYFDVGLRRTGADADEAAYPMRYYSRANEGTVSELAQEVSLRLLPALRGRQPKRLAFQLWAGSTPNADSPAFLEALAETTRATGFTEWIGSAEGQRFGLESGLLVNFKSYSINLAPWLREHKEARLVGGDGKADETLMCTSVLLESGWKQAGEPLLREWWEKRRVNVVNYDYEYPPFVGPHSCYCERCLAAFRNAAGLGEGVALTAENIRSEHGAAWADFMARRVAKIFRLMKESVATFPGKVRFEVYSGYPTPDNATRYGVDWRYVGQEQAADRVGMGYGRPPEALAHAREVLQGIPALYGELVTPYLSNQRSDFNRPPRPVTKANLLRRFLDATGGALIYHAQNMDGRSWLAAAEISRLVAEHEPLFGPRPPEPVAGQPEAEVAMLKGEAATLVCVMNPGAKEKSFTIPSPQPERVATEFYSQRTQPAGEPLQARLAPGDAAVFILNPQKP